MGRKIKLDNELFFSHYSFTMTAFGHSDKPSLFTLAVIISLLQERKRLTSKQSKLWHLANPSYRREYMRDYLAERKVRKPLDSIGLTMFFAWCLLRPAMLLEKRRAKDRTEWQVKKEDLVFMERRRAQKRVRRAARIKDPEYKEHVNAVVRAAYPVKMKDPNFRIRRALAQRVRGALKGGIKSIKTMELVGCTIPELVTHLQSQFVAGMSWENYGPVWHIDHIRPCASFDLTDPSRQRECFHFSNLQPLFAKDNISKGDKILSPSAL